MTKQPAKPKKKTVRVKAWGVFHATWATSPCPLWVHAIHPTYSKRFRVLPITITYEARHAK